MKNYKLFLVEYLLFIFLSVAAVGCSNGNDNLAKRQQLPLPTIPTDPAEISVDKSALKEKMAAVANWQMANFKYSKEGKPGYLHDYGIDAWTNATLYLGLSEWATLAGDPLLYEWLLKIGNENNWKIPANFEQNERYKFYHADELCIGQFYFAMYKKYGNAKMISSIIQRTDWIIDNPPKENMDASNKQAWTWCDALFMAPAVYINRADLSNDIKYLEFMDQQFKKTYNTLYNKDHKLFYRDSSYFDKKEDNGTDVFWGRGNGWVAAGLVNILKLLPEDSPYLSFYQDLFKEFVPTLAYLQSSEGYWQASLLDPSSYPSPETSATALIAYAIAYGINANLLPKDEYLPILLNAWNALDSFVNGDGKLGYVQPIGADPKKVTAEMTAVYGVGAFLLAGSELYRMNME